MFKRQKWQVSLMGEMWRLGIKDNKEGRSMRASLKGREMLRPCSHAECGREWVAASRLGKRSTSLRSRKEARVAA